MKGREKYYMKLKTLSISKLYGAYDYEVDFNSDITFLYGTNGCGKTTILNITEAIITGMLFKLFEYDFNNITLEYYKTKAEEDIKRIDITKNRTKILSVLYEDQEYKLEQIRFDSDDNIVEITQKYFKKYSFLQKIHHSFNYVYLPLNRDMNYGNSY